MVNLLCYLQLSWKREQMRNGSLCHNALQKLKTDDLSS